MFKGIDESNISDYEKIWLPKMGEQSREDLHWDWRAKIGKYSNPLLYSHFCIEHQKETQGLAVVTKGGAFSRLPEMQNQDIMYLNYLAVAPWNHKAYGSNRRFKGVGLVLVGAVVQLSLDEGLSGRVGLHSLSNAEGFYKSLGFEDLGADDQCQNLKYFELPAEQVNKFFD